MGIDLCFLTCRLRASQRAVCQRVIHRLCELSSDELASIRDLMILLCRYRMSAIKRSNQYASQIASGLSVYSIHISVDFSWSSLSRRFMRFCSAGSIERHYSSHRLVISVADDIRSGKHSERVSVASRTSLTESVLTSCKIRTFEQRGRRTSSHSAKQSHLNNGEI